MYLTIQAIVLRVTDYNDRDALLTVLSKNHGKLTIKARGLRRKNSPLIAPCQLLAFGEFTLFEYRGMYTINEAHSLELFQHLRRDLTKLSLGTYFAQATEVISQEDLPNPELLALLLNSLYALNTLNLPEYQIKAAFELRLACLAGYTPEIFSYSENGPSPDRFDLSAGQLVYSGHVNSYGGIRMPLNPGMLQAMQYICMCEPKKLFAFSLGEENMQALSSLTEAYLTTQLERGFATLDFYKSLLI